MRPQQVHPPNQIQGNSSNLQPNSSQIQPQMGIINPQMSIPFNSFNMPVNNGNLAMPNRAIMAPAPCFMNAPNQPFVLQFPNGFGPQSLIPMAMNQINASQMQNLNSVPMNQFNSSKPQNMNSMQMNQINSSQMQNLNSMTMNQFNSSQPQSLNSMPMNQYNSSQLQNLTPMVMNQMNPFQPNNPMNMTPYFNQNAGFQNGQLCMQNMGQFVQMQMPNFAQAFPGNLPMGPQNGTVAVNQQFGQVHSNGVAQQGNQGQVNELKPALNGNIQQLQGNPPMQFASDPVQPQKSQNFNPVITNSQGNPTKENEVQNLNPNWKISQNRNFTRHPKNEASHNGFTKFPQNAHGKPMFHKERGGKGYNNNRERKSGLADSCNQTQVEKKRVIPLNYTEQEIQQWREERKKNYPSKANNEKKLTQREVADRDATLRRQQLKEILAKQAELGCEIAEIPSSYLSDSEKQVHDKEDYKQGYGKKGNFRNKFNKRERFNKNSRFNNKQGPVDQNSPNPNNQNEGFTKKQKFANNSSTTPTMSKKEPTLLQKLLSGDVRRDKAYLLQAFRFMVMNSFFKDWPEKELRFPEVIVKEGGEGELKEKSSLVIKDVFEGCEETFIKESNGNDEDEISDQVNKFGNFGKKDSSVSVMEPEEEGEIID